VRRVRRAYCVQTLDVGDVLADHEFQLFRQLAVGYAASSGSCCKRHVVFSCLICVQDNSCLRSTEVGSGGFGEA
jgi:hypothetical protein